ncbi:FN3 associated domain-containing protein, partial [Vibrio sp. FNV 38]|nr:FN3 associated domain-containing protein [Vibrio sp. FNV 38]
DPANGTTFGDEGLEVSITCATDGATIYYTTDGEVPTNESTVYNEPFSITETTTVKAIAYVGEDASTVASATYTYVDPNAPGSLNNPYTVAEARAAIDAGTGVNGVYATGIVSEIVDPYSTQFHNVTFNMVDA